MNTEYEKCLATKAHEQIGICCETLCDKQLVQEYIKSIEKENLKLKNIIQNLNTNKNSEYFICGEDGPKNKMGLPKVILVCFNNEITAYTKQHIKVCNE